MVVNQRHFCKTHWILTFWLQTEKRFPKSSGFSRTEPLRPIRAGFCREPTNHP